MTIDRFPHVPGSIRPAGPTITTGAGATRPSPAASHANAGSLRLDAVALAAPRASEGPVPLTEPRGAYRPGELAALVRSAYAPRSSLKRPASETPAPLTTPRKRYRPGEFEAIVAAMPRVRFNPKVDVVHPPPSP